TTMAEIQDRKFKELGFQKVNTTKGVVSYSQNLEKAASDNPIIILLHGYPQSSYIWRLIAPLLNEKPLFIPDLPGYGQSKPVDQNDKLSIGTCIMEALRELISESKSTNSVLPVVLAGHDRGAKVAQALQVNAGKSDVSGFSIVGLTLFDVVPTLYQWGIGNSAAAQKGYFHWSFLANVPIAKRMIMAYGGGQWAKDMIDGWSGSNKDGLEKLKSGDSLKVYNEFFNNESVVEASCLDYEAGAGADVDRESDDIENGRSISVPFLLIYSADFLSKRAKKPISEVWGAPWTKAKIPATFVPIGGGIGHFIPEEAPEQAAAALLDWLRSIQS
ncbi:alpha/beta-hydrolase, partial [Myriangium duriaei CBS 260.36]